MNCALIHNGYMRHHVFGTYRVYSELRGLDMVVAIFKLNLPLLVEELCKKIIGLVSLLNSSWFFEYYHI